ncbi:unnamed protein product [Malus baccata var. baccata]
MFVECGIVDEMENHLFFRCELSHLFWFSSHLHLNSFHLEGSDFLGTWENFCNRVQGMANEMEIMQEFVFGLWRLWKNQNEVVFNGVSRQPLEVVEVWKQNIAEFRGARAQEGVGWVVRDFAGLLQAARGSGELFFHSAAAAEVVVVRDVLEFCCMQGFDQLVVESDTRVIVQMLRKEMQPDFNLDCILSDIERLVQSMRSVTFAFVPREVNGAAHSVAKFVFREGKTLLWNCIGLEFLFNILAQDINLSICL